ncbi:hypothetical protein EBS02_02320 [bacterium]|nr:hypothetical protein [bacterium]
MTVYNFTEFIQESLISKPNTWEVSYPQKWAALQELGFRDATSNIMKKIGNNVLLMNDRLPFYPDGIVYQESGYLRDKSASSGWITRGKNWEEAADYIINKFSLLKSLIPPGVEPEIFTLFLNGVPGITPKIKGMINIDPANKTVEINADLTIDAKNKSDLISSGYKIKKVDNLTISGSDFDKSGMLNLNLADCLQLMPEQCENLFVKTVNFNDDCRNVSFFPLVKDTIMVTNVKGFENCMFLHPAQYKLKNLILDFQIRSLKGLFVENCTTVRISREINGEYFVQIVIGGYVNNKKWNLAGWVDILKNGNAEESNLMSTFPLLQAEFWESLLTGDLKKDGQTLLDISYLWDLPDWQTERIKIEKNLSPMQIKAINVLKTKHEYLPK